MTSTKLCCFFLSALWCSWVWSVKICRRVSASLRACSQEPFWGIRDEERRKQWRKPSWVSHTILWACEKVGMFIPAGLWDGGLLSWETITRNKPPSSQGDQHQRLPWAESVVKKKNHKGWLTSTWNHENCLRYFPSYMERYAFEICIQNPALIKRAVLSSTKLNSFAFAAEELLSLWSWSVWFGQTHLQNHGPQVAVALLTPRSRVTSCYKHELMTQ